MYAYQRLDASKRAHSGLMMTLKATDDAWHPKSKALFDQLKRAAISIEANLVEGYALGTRPLFRKHVRIAFGSAAEAECLTRAAHEAGYLKARVATELEMIFGGGIGHSERHPAIPNITYGALSRCSPQIVSGNLHPHQPRLDEFVGMLPEIVQQRRQRGRQVAQIGVHHGVRRQPAQRPLAAIDPLQQGIDGRRRSGKLVRQLIQIGGDRIDVASGSG